MSRIKRDVKENSPRPEAEKTVSRSSPSNPQIALAKGFGFGLPAPVGFIFLVMTTPIESGDRASETGLGVAVTMVLSEACGSIGVFLGYPEEA